MYHYYRLAGWAAERQHEQRRLADQLRQAERARLARTEPASLAGLAALLHRLAGGRRAIVRQWARLSERTA